MSLSIDQAPRKNTEAWKPYTVIIGALAIILYFLPFDTGSFGTIDFVQYWSAWKLMAQGQNPYDPFLLHNIQSALSSAPSPLIYSWNPPWTFTLLAPFHLPSFLGAAKLWCLFQVCSLLFIASKAPKALNVPNIGVVGGACVALAFLPSLYTIFYGQLGTLFALACTCFLLALRRHSYALAGISLLPLTLKPHLFVLLAIPGIVWLMQIPRAAAVRFLLGSMGGFALLIGVTYAVEPSSISWWLNAMLGPYIAHPQRIHYQQWMTHTPATALRLALLHIYGVNPTWPLLVIPAGGFVLTALYFFIRRPFINWTTLLPSMLCLSFASSSYAWVYDQPPLVLCQYLLISHALNGRRDAISSSILIGCVGIQLAPLLLAATNNLPGYAFFLMPWALLALSLWANRRERITPRSY
jgi:hypothetical protein